MVKPIVTISIIITKNSIGYNYNYSNCYNTIIVTAIYRLYK